MIKVKNRAGESIQQMVKRFKKMCEKEGLIRDIKRNSYFEKPSEKNRRKRKKSQRMARITSSNRIWPSFEELTIQSGHTFNQRCPGFLRAAWQNNAI